MLHNAFPLHNGKYVLLEFEWKTDYSTLVMKQSTIIYFFWLLYWLISDEAYKNKVTIGTPLIFPQVVYNPNRY